MYNYEQDLLKKGYQFIGGCDEVGRGPLIGPVVCACVVLDPNNKIEGLNDSKKLSHKKRVLLDKEIKEKALSYQIEFISEQVIDQINILEASKLGMLEAVNNMSITPDYLLNDAVLLKTNIPQLKIIKGDSKSASIAAASIIAKVARDAYMDILDEQYPMYDFKNNKGYPTKKHIEAIHKYGILKEHRRSFNPIKSMMQMSFDI